MPPTFIRSAEAEDDLIAIWCYIAADDPSAADRLLDRLDDAYSRLAQFPDIGRHYD